MAGEKLQNWQRDVLRPFRDAWEGMYSLVFNASDNELQAMIGAACATNETNCAWSEYAVARRFLIDEVHSEIRRRELLTEVLER